MNKLEAIGTYLMKVGLLLTIIAFLVFVFFPVLFFIAGVSR
jgi:hypothetical protein